MPNDGASSAPRTEAGRAFEAIADAIMYRWAVERDTWVSATEVETARAYLERAGVPVSAMPDGRFAIKGETATALGASRVVLLGLRHLHATRRSTARP
jgi:hypothetical protein